MLRLFRRKKAAEEKPKAAEALERDILRELCGDDEKLYEAMGYVILLNPERLMELRTSESFAETAEEAEARGDFVKARIAYESAGKLAIYHGDASTARTYFTRCLGLPEVGERVEIYRTILASMDRVMEIAGRYYRSKPSVSSA